MVSGHGKRGHGHVCVGMVSVVTVEGAWAWCGCAACSKIWSGSTLEWKETKPTPQQRRQPGSHSSRRIVAWVGWWGVVGGEWCGGEWWVVSGVGVSGGW